MMVETFSRELLGSQPRSLASGARDLSGTRPRQCLLLRSRRGRPRRRCAAEEECPSVLTALTRFAADPHPLPSSGRSVMPARIKVSRMA